MINYLTAAFYGIVQGFTEFLPVSSSGHLVILHDTISLPIKNKLLFDVMLHLATLLAVIWFFRSDIQQLFKSWLKSFTGQSDAFSRLSWLIILATIPAALAGWLFQGTIELMRSPIIVAVMLIAGGLLFILFEKVSRKTDELDNINWRKSLIIGLAQAIALIPGTSRSGITIIAGLATGLKRQAALRFSFLLSVPIILGANIKKIPEIFSSGQNGDEAILFAIGFIFALISGMLAIKFFLQYARKHSLLIFAIYRFVLAIIVIGVMY